jgi:hypothetical protein
LTIDTTAGTVTQSNLVVGSPDNTVQTNPVAQGQNLFNAGTYGVDDRNASSTEDFNFSIPEGGSLVNYAGGSTNYGNLYNLVTNSFGSNISNFKLTPAPSAVVVNVQLNSTIGAYTGQGAFVTSDAHIWNNNSTFPPPSTFVDSAGVTTPVTVHVTSDSLYTPGSWTGNNLLDQSAENTATAESFTIGGLSTNAKYDLFLYGWNQDGTKAQPFAFGSPFSITTYAGGSPNPQTTAGGGLVSGTDYTSSTISPSAAGRAYVEYTNLIPNSSGQITGTYGPYGTFNGFQLIGPLVLPPNKIISLTAAAPGTYANQLTESTHPGTDQAIFSPNDSDNIIHVTGAGSGRYNPGYANSIGPTINGENKFFTEATGWNPTNDQEIYALKIRISNGVPSAAQDMAVVNDINGSNTGNVTASLVSGTQYAALFPGYQILLTASGGTVSPEFLGIDFTADTNTTGVTVTDIAVIPEPASAAGILLGAACFLLGRRKRNA